jgi:alpha-tubulin suppressor-like RCC1 family protein
VLLVATTSCILNRVGFVQLGDGTNTNRNTPSADVLTSVAAISAGQYHACALTTSGGVRCWGHNVNGEVRDVHACCLLLLLTAY